MQIGVRSKLSHGPRSRFKREVQRPKSHSQKDSNETKVHYVYGKYLILLFPSSRRFSRFKGENVKEYVMKFYPNFIAEPVATDLNTYVVNDISSFTKKDQNHSLQINAGNNKDDKVTAIARGTTQIWKPYSASYIGSLYF